MRGEGGRGGEEERPSNKLLLNVADYVSRYAEQAFQIKSVPITETGRISDSSYGPEPPSSRLDKQTRRVDRNSEIFHYISGSVPIVDRCPRGLKRGSAAVGFQELRVRISQEAWMSVCCKCCVLSRTGLCVGLIPRPEESHRVLCVLLRATKCNNNPLQLQRIGRKTNR